MSGGGYGLFCVLSGNIPRTSYVSSSDSGTTLVPLL